MQIEPRTYDHPDVVMMVADLQLEYQRRYGDEGDTSPIDRADFVAPRGWFSVGYLDGSAVAMGGWRLLVPGGLVPGGRPAEIKRMYVVPGARGRGLARRMLAAVEGSAGMAGIDFLVLETGTAQPEAIGLYRSCGYTDAPRFGHYAHEPESVHLGKSLAPAVTLAG